MNAIRSLFPVLALLAFLWSPAQGQVPGTFPSLLVAAEKKITFVNTANPAIDATSSGTTHTFSSISLGANGANRVVVIAIGYLINSGTETITSVALSGGGTATAVKTATVTSVNNAVASIWKITGVTATTDTLTVTLSGALGANRGLGVSVYNLLGASSTEFATNSATATSGTASRDISLNTVANGAVITAGSSVFGTSMSYSGVSLSSLISNASAYIATGGNATATASTPLSVSGSVSGGSPEVQAFASASFQPL